MNARLKSKEADKLFEAMALLKSTDEYYMFFEDLCSVSEFQSLAHRFSVALLLSSGKTYSEVALLSGASTATISRISKCLSYGAEGYNIAIERLKDGETN